MSTITIPKEAKKAEKLVAIPKADYDLIRSFISGKNRIRTYKPTVVERKAIREGRKQFARGNFVTLQELKNELDRHYRRSR